MLHLRGGTRPCERRRLQRPGQSRPPLAVRLEVRVRLGPTKASPSDKKHTRQMPHKEPEI